MQRTRNWSRRQCEHVRLQLELLEPLFVLHTEPMLFVDDDQPEVVEDNVGT